MPERKRHPDRPALRENPELAAEASDLVAHLDRAMRQLVLAVGEENDAPMRFRRSEIAVIDTLGAEGSMAMGELAGRVRLPLSTATRIVDRLVQRKMVERERLEDNRRVVQVRLAQVGLRFYRAALHSRIAGAQRMLRRLDGNERRELVRLVRKIAESASEGPKE